MSQAVDCPPFNTLTLLRGQLYGSKRPGMACAAAPPPPPRRRTASQPPGAVPGGRGESRPFCLSCHGFRNFLECPTLGQITKHSLKRASVEAPMCVLGLVTMDDDVAATRLQLNF